MQAPPSTDLLWSFNMLHFVFVATLFTVHMFLPILATGWLISSYKINRKIGICHNWPQKLAAFVSGTYSWDNLGLPNTAQILAPVGNELDFLHRLRPEWEKHIITEGTIWNLLIFFSQLSPLPCLWGKSLLPDICYRKDIQKGNRTVKIKI